MFAKIGNIDVDIFNSPIQVGPDSFRAILMKEGFTISPKHIKCFYDLRTKGTKYKIKKKKACRIFVRILVTFWSFWQECSNPNIQCLPLYSIQSSLFAPKNWK